MSRMEAERLAMELNSLNNGFHYWANIVMYNWVVWKRDPDGYVSMSQVLRPIDKSEGRLAL